MSVNEGSAELDGFYPFLSEVAAMRRRARSHIEAVGAAAELSPQHPIVLQLLNEALATELVCVSHYRNRCVSVAGALAASVREEFHKYAQEEQGHADRLADRILQLGGEPNRDVPVLPSETAAPVEALEPEALVDLLEEDLIAERIAIESYREILQFVGARDLRTRELLEAILAVEIAHAQELAAMRSELLRRDRLLGSTSTSLPTLDLQCA
jgi:bacterioferritin